MRNTELSIEQIAARDGLLEEIYGNPEDIDTRRVYADWLEEHGDAARADEIRSSIDKRPNPLKRPRAPKQSKRYDLEKKYGVTFGSGEACVGMSAEQVLSGAFTELRASHPEVKSLFLTECSAKQWAELLENNQEDFKSLLGLSVFKGDIGTTGAIALAKYEPLSNLRQLSLFMCNVSEIGAAALANSHTLCKLRELCLTGNNIGDKGAAALAASTVLSGLHTMSLADNCIGDNGAAALAASTTLSCLRKLFLHCNQIHDRGAQRLAGAAGLGGLQELNLSFNSIGDDGAAALAESKLSQLQVLSLGHNHIGSRGAVLLTRSTSFGNLRKLDLGSNNISEGGDEIASYNTLENLSYLGLGNNPIAPEQIAALRFALPGNVVRFRVDPAHYSAASRAQAMYAELDVPGETVSGFDVWTARLKPLQGGIG